MTAKIENKIRNTVHLIHKISEADLDNRRRECLPRLIVKTTNDEAILRYLHKLPIEIRFCGLRNQRSNKS